jgi:hypothetical protein
MSEPNCDKNDGLTAGEAAKSAAFAKLEHFRSAKLLEARLSIASVLLTVGEATIDDLPEAVRSLPEGVDAKLFGPTFSVFVNLKFVEKTGYRKTSRSVAHARDVAVWSLIEHAALSRWVEAHGGGSAPNGSACPLPGPAPVRKPPVLAPKPPPKPKKQGTLFDCRDERPPD